MTARILSAFGFAIVAAGVIFAWYNSTGEEGNRSSLTVRFPIPIVENGQSPFYAALDSGSYEEEGLKVTFNLGSPELNPVAMVVSGQDDIGVLGGPDTLLVANSRGSDLVAIAVLHRESNFPVFLSLESSGVKHPKDLEGKRVGFFYGHISTDVLRNFLRRQNITVEEVDTGFDYAPLITGDVVAEWAFRVTAGLDLPSKGIAVNTIDPADYGIISHGYTIFVRRSFLEENRDALVRFLRATFRGVEAVVETPSLGARLIEERNPQADPEVTLRRQELYNSVTTGYPPYEIGHMDGQMFEETYLRLKEEGVLDSDLIISNQFDPTLVEEISMYLTDNNVP